MGAKSYNEYRIQEAIEMAKKLHDEINCSAIHVLRTRRKPTQFQY